MDDVKLDAIVSLCKRRGFIFQGSEIFGGLAGTWDYGPLGLALKRNIENLWWNMFVDTRDDIFGIDAAILMNQKVWQASGHVETFNDPMIECGNCHNRFRTDKIINHDNYMPFMRAMFDKLKKDIESTEEEVIETEELIKYNQENEDQKLQEEINKRLKESESAVKKHKLVVSDFVNAPKYIGHFPAFYLNELAKIKCPVCGEIEWNNSRSFNMMFKTQVGPTWMGWDADGNNYITGNLQPVSPNGDKLAPFSIPEDRKLSGIVVYDKNAVSYLRPETAQGIFTNFKNIIDCFYPDMPFGIAQQGKSFRNEISPRDFVFRSREFEQMEIEYFVHPDNWEAEFEIWRKLVIRWIDSIGLPKEKVHELEVPESERAHYSKRTIDFEFDFPHGRDELLGLAYRANFDLNNIQKASGKNMLYRPKYGGPTFIPHVIEPSFGVERAFMAALTSAYCEDEIDGEKRIVLKLPYKLAPIKCAIGPLLKNKDELSSRARGVYDMLRKDSEYAFDRDLNKAIVYDDNGNIGKRYRRQDEIGTPYCITIDFQTLEDDTVTVRFRDTAKQDRVKIDDLVSKIRSSE